jgi:DNA primase large subunit
MGVQFKMENLDLNTLSRFPFLYESTSYIKRLNLSIDNILNSFAYRSAWSRGKARLKEALELGEIQDPGTSTEAEYITELLSYVIARVITSCISDSYLIRRYALAEAVYAYKGLKEKDPNFVGAVAGQFNLKPIKIDDDEIKISVFDYLKYSTILRSPEYKLVNRDVTLGSVFLSSRELSRLVQEAIRKKILMDLPININDKLKKQLKPEIQDLITIVQNRKKHFETQDLGKVSILRFPPCMKQLLGMTQAGENVPHVGRFAIATFLHHIGLTSDQILNAFSSSPDFDVDKARYQVEHITGKISGTEYTPPSCDTMKSNGICYTPDELCNKDWLSHPLTYYRIKGKRKITTAATKKIKKDNVKENVKDNVKEKEKNKVKSEEKAKNDYKDNKKDNEKEKN